MKDYLSLALGLALILLPAAVHAADPMVSNLTAAQLAGTKPGESPASFGRVLSEPVHPEQSPKGLSDSDWSGIRGAYEKHRHTIVANSDGSHQARNPGQAWLARFDGHGFLVTPDTGGWTWGLELVGYGDATEVLHEGGKISYVREDGLTEWFINDVRGLEQGWTLAKRPKRAGASGPVQLDLTVRGGLRPQVSPEGASAAFVDKSGSSALTYGGLKAWDAEGKTVPAHFAEAETGGLSVVVDDTAARYPITVDPVAQQQAYLKASNTGANDAFGRSVAVSGDTVVVGAEGEASSATGVNGNQADNSAPGSGAAYVFVRSGGNWSQQAYLKPSNRGYQFGGSVAVSGDTVVVGASSESSSTTGINSTPNELAPGSGAAYVFVRSGGNWSQQAYLKASNTDAQDHFGISVAVSGDTVVVGAFLESSGATGVNGNQADNSAIESGAAYVFSRSGENWSQQAYLKASNTDTPDFFGYSVAVSGDTVVVGALGEASGATGVNGNQADNSAPGSGAAYVFVRSGGNWSQQTYLKASNTDTQDHFGYSVAVSGDTVVVGAEYEASSATGVNGNQADNSALSSGATYVFTGLGRHSLLTSALNGVVEGAGNYDIGVSAIISATPDLGYVFSNWSGDATGTDNPLSVMMDADKTITANFAPDPSDADGDGLSTYLEVVVYGTDLALADSDGDGLSDSWEVGLGRFSIIPGSFTWSQARSDAHSRGGELACFPTEALWNRAMENLGANALDNYVGLWIGASDDVTEGTWTWLTGKPFAFTNWASGEPDNLNNADYAEVSGGEGGMIGKWYDRRSITVRDAYIFETGVSTDPNNADEDNDGLKDGAEQAAGSNPFLADTDGDGLTDGQEVNLTQTNPKLADSNNNGTNDAAEDSDNDGLTHLVEVTQQNTDPLDDDSDNDGLKDGAEVNYAGSYYKLVQGSFTYPQAVADATAKHGRVASFPNAADYTRMANKARQTTQGYLWIGLSDVATEGTWMWTNGTAATYNRWLAGQPSGGATENHVVIMENTTQWADTLEAFTAAGYLFERVGLDPLDPDTDGDYLSDGREVNTTGSSPVLEDTDGDGLTDGAEFDTHGSSPLLSDTDGDGLSDRGEVEDYQSNPLLNDSDGDGFEDLFEVNTGFNPALNTSTPDAISSIRTAVEFRFNAANGVSYRIEASTDLNEWNTIETNILGASAVVTRFYSIENQPKRYFRVRRN